MQVGESTFSSKMTRQSHYDRFTCSQSVVSAVSAQGVVGYTTKVRCYYSDVDSGWLKCTSWMYSLCLSGARWHRKGPRGDQTGQQHWPGKLQLLQEVELFWSGLHMYGEALFTQIPLWSHSWSRQWLDCRCIFIKTISVVRKLVWWSCLLSFKRVVILCFSWDCSASLHVRQMTCLQCILFLKRECFVNTWLSCVEFGG